ncbi:MAG: glucose/galactose MFS transporter [Acetobacter peroxydans]|nr:glucose/galactose MFS transporter [Acetobacter peroxydans]MCI2007231.1 glucose/galactose MFS transporter [Acetobacter peroxydans]MCI2077636.1 glucose/galactose MFS transporter [Acetobacter peroxydans]
MNSPAAPPPDRSACPAGTFGWGPLACMAGLFFIIGFATWLNGPLIPFVQVAFSLDDVSAFLVPLVFYIAYVVFALPAGHLAAQTGPKRTLPRALGGMALGMAITAGGLHAGLYPLALTGLLTLGGGLAFLQVAVNPYVTLLGPHARAAQRIAIMGVCNKLGGIVAPLVLAGLAMRNMNGLTASLIHTPDASARAALRAQALDALAGPYLGMAILLTAAAFGIARAHLPDLRRAPSSAPSHERGSATSHPHTVLTRPWPLHPRALLGAGAMFLYVGVEVLAGDAIGTYARASGLPLNQSGFFTALTLSCMLAGYLCGLALIPRRISQEHYLLLCCLAGAGLALLACATHGYASVLCLGLFGFANAMIFPSLFPIVLRGNAADSARISALLVMAYSGGGIMPQVFIRLAAHVGFHPALALVSLPSYLMIAVYGWYFSHHRPLALMEQAPS